MRSCIQEENSTVLSRDICLEEALFSLLPPSSLAGLVRGESENIFPQMYWFLKMLGKDMSHVQRW